MVATCTTTDVETELAEVRAEILEIQSLDLHGRGLEHHTDIRLQKAVARLNQLNDLRHGIVRGAPSDSFEVAGIAMQGRMSDAPKPLDHAKSRKRRKKRTAADVVPNVCYCDQRRYGQDGGRKPKKQVRAKSAYDLCTRGPSPADGTKCQVYQLFSLAIASPDKHPADFVKERHWFEPTDEDREYLDWVCLLWCRDWLTAAQLQRYAGLSGIVTGTYPFAYASSYPALAGVKITEATFADFLTTYRSRAL